MSLEHSKANLKHNYDIISGLITIISLLAFGNTCIGISLAINTTYWSEDPGTSASAFAFVSDSDSPGINKFIKSYHYYHHQQYKN